MYPWNCKVQSLEVVHLACIDDGMVEFILDGRV